MASISQAVESVAKDSALDWPDHAVITVYLAGMIALGFYLGRRKRSADEYFLAGRSMPWFAVGVSVIASILSSITYLSEPGEVWKSGITHLFGKMLAIPLEMAFVFFFCVPFLMRFRFTSVYEYLEHRFGKATRHIGTVLFVTLVILWMGIVVLTSARVLSHVGGWPLSAVIAVVGIVATLYTMLGGLRAVIWTDVIQVALLVGGGLFTICYVMLTTGSWLPDWYAATTAHLDSISDREAMPFFSLDPSVRVSVVTVALHMMVWHICTHLSNQMTVQRYFSTRDTRSARKSFLTGSLLGVAINLMLMVTGLALLYYYIGQPQPVPLDGGIDPSNKSRDLIFPTFAVHHLPPGLGGAILAALIAAAMSSIDSGINSIATVLTAGSTTSDTVTAANHPEGGRVRHAKILTVAAGLFITAAATLLDSLPPEWSIIDLLPRTFNAITAPLGTLFLIGMFLPRAGQRSVIIGVVCSLAVSIAVGYSRQLGLHPTGISLTWVMPGALLTGLGVAALAGLSEKPASPGSLAGLTWRSRDEPSPFTHGNSEA